MHASSATCKACVIGTIVLTGTCCLCSLHNLVELWLLQVKGQRRITFDQFVNALGIISEKKGQPLKDVIQPILQAGGPSVTGTKAGYVKFHDDKVGDPAYVPESHAMKLVCI